MTSRRRYDEKDRKKRKKKKGKRRAERKLLEESLFSSKPREGRSEFCVEGGMRLPSLIDKLNSYDPSSCDRTSEQKRQRRASVQGTAERKLCPDKAGRAAGEN